MAPSNNSAVARSGPLVSPPATGCPGTNRRSSNVSASVRLVEPTSVTVASPGAASSTSRIVATADPTGTATTTSCASRTASSTEERACERCASRRLAQPARIGVERGDRGDARARGGQADRRSEQTGSDDGEALDSHRLLARQPVPADGRPAALASSRRALQRRSRSPPAPRAGRGSRWRARGAARIRALRRRTARSSHPCAPARSTPARAGG